MADYFTRFSCLFKVGSAENAAKAEKIRDELAAEMERPEGATLDFNMESAHALSPGALWIYSDDYGDPKHVTRFVLRCAEALNLTGPGDSAGVTPAVDRVSTPSAAARRSSIWTGVRRWIASTAMPGSTA